MEIKKIDIYEKMLNIVLDIIIFIFGIILLISVYNSIQVKLLGNDYSSFFGYTVFEVQTGSMADAINAGDWIIVKKDNKIELNDVITFEQDGEFITHRVIEMYKGTFITKGDANNTKDDPITKEQIVGRVVKVLPCFGIFKKTIFNPIVLLTLIVTLYLCSLLFKKKTNSDFKNLSIKDMLIGKVKLIFNDGKVKEDNLNDIAKELKENKLIKESKEKQVVEEVKYEQVTDKKDEYEVSKLKNVDLINDENFDKTMYFRAITVDKDEINKTFLEIKKNNEINKLDIEKNKSKEKNKDKEKSKISLKDDNNETILNEALEMMKLKVKKKFNNIIDKVMYIKEQELNDIVEILTNKASLAVNEATIKKTFVSMFIDVKYYNHCGNVDVEYNGKNMTTRIVDSINDKQGELLKNYKGTDTKYALKVKKYANIFILIMYLEQANGTIEDVSIIKEMYKKRITKYSEIEMDDASINSMINKILKTQRLYSSMVNYTLKQLDTKTFTLEYNQLTTRKNLYGLELKHNISFSKVYSEYIVDKTYSEGVIAEDKIKILITLLSTRLASDMLDLNFKNKYILYIPSSLYSKENKLGQLSKIMDNEFIKNNVIILAKFEEFIKNKSIIKSLKKEGYKFALDFDKEVDIKAKDQSTIYLADYIFINKEKVDVKNIIKMIPVELKNNIIEENIENKIGNYGGE